jgi:hypothetical protein
MEIKVVNFIKEGRTTKEMAALLHASAGPWRFTGTTSGKRSD